MVNTITQDVNKAQRLWAAEGINVLDIRNAIETEGQKMRTYGRFPGSPVLNIKTADELVAALEYTTEYGGGYLYDGDKISVNGKYFPPKTYTCNRKPYCVVPNYEEMVVDLWKTLKKDDVFVVENHSDTLSSETWHFDGKILVHVENYSERAKIMEEEGVFLPPGIRKRVADKLGYNLTSTNFHTAFNRAIDLLVLAS